MNITAGRKPGPSPTAPSEQGWASFAVSGVDKFPGPAFVVCANNWLAYANVHAEPLVAALRDQDFNLTGIITRCLSGDAPAVQKITLSSETGTRHLDVYAIPVTLDETAAFALNGSEDRRGAMVFARETTLEHNLTSALVESRQMFKDLTSCSSDFAWETDIHGIFRYVSAGGAFGYGAHELTGRRARDLFADENADDNPFTARIKVESMPVKLHRSDGGQAFILVTATPVLNQRGEYLGARGVCCDVTAKKLQEEAYSRLQTRHTVMTTLASLARDVAASQQIINSAATVVGQTLRAPCWILRRMEGEFVIEGATPGTIAADLHEAVLDVLEGVVAMHRSAASLRPTVEHLEASEAAIVATSHHGVINGALVVLRPLGEDFSDHDLTLLDEASEQVSLILNQAENVARISALSRVDDLTGLLNARAFTEVIERRIKHQQRTEMAATLLIAEVDDYAEVVERFGRPLAEGALKRLGETLRSRSRAGDVLARLDTARFALWLEDTDLKGASQKAKLVLRQSREIALGKVSGTGSISLSVGGAPSEPSPETTLEKLIAQADLALSEAKKMGYGRWKIQSFHQESSEDE